MKKHQLPPLSRLRELFHYDATSGTVLSLTDRPRVPKGSIVGNLHNGYLRTVVDYQLYQLHRIVWYIQTGEDPSDFEIDHIDGNRSNNAWTNLRRADESQNQRNKKLQRNNTSGIKGVSWDKRSGSWRACVKVNGKQVGLGLHASKATAGEVVRKYRETLHKEFANHG